MAQVTLIDPAGWQGAAAGQRPYPNIGIAFLIPPLLRAGHSVEVIDLNNETLSQVETIDRIVALRPDVVGFSVKTATMKSSRLLGRSIRPLLPETRIILGGPHATLCGSDLIHEGWVDAVMAGEGEERIADVVDHLVNRDAPASVDHSVEHSGPPEKLFVRSPAVADLDTLAYSEYGAFPASVQAFLSTGYPLITSRGCVFGCTYCSVPTISGRCFRRRAPERIVAELTWARRRWGIVSFELIDDSFNIDMRHSKRICQALIEADLGLRWTCPNGIRADLIDEELASLMASAGCWMVMLGVEHADPGVLRAANKGETLGDIERGIRCLQRAGIEVGGYFIIGLPGDSLAATQASIDFAARLGIVPRFNMLVPYPGTALWSWVQRHGRQLADIEDGMHFAAGGALLPTFETPEFPARDRIRAWAMVHTKTRRFDMILPTTRRRWLDPLRKLDLVFRYDRRNLRSAVVHTIRRSLGRPERTPQRIDRLASIPGDEPESRHAASPDAPLRPGEGFLGAPRRLRILVVSNLFPPDVVGGYEIACSEAVEGLRARGHQVSVLTSCFGIAPLVEEPSIRRALTVDLGWERTPGWRYVLKLLRKERDNRLAFRRRLSAGPFDLVFFWNLRFLSVSLLDIALETGVPFATYVFDDWMASMASDDAWLAWLRRRPSRFLKALLKRGVVALAPVPYKRADPSCRSWPNSIFGSDYLRQRALSAGTAEANTPVIYWGIDTAKFSPSDPQRRPPSRLLYCGQVTPAKGVHTVVEAFAILTRDGRCPNLQLTIAGGSTQAEYLGELKARVASAGLGERVRFTGFLARDRLAALYREHDILIFPSVWEEPFGIAFLEAMASGLAVVTTATGGNSEITIPGTNALVFPRGDAEGCARTVARLIDEPELYAEIGRHARAFVVERHRFNDTLLRIEQHLLALAPVAGGAGEFTPGPARR
ncbi:glycosyltransferase [Gryllotalpicola sp.]|uniref:glycosyltransferase n=1 Tax=Gryllotalpicola sp. TaxID=1932787 RepID=UPI00260E7BE8|nr:glycosyltransferase [Gryllotalpicola sp.]